MRRNSSYQFAALVALTLLIGSLTIFPAQAGTEIYLIPSVNAFDTATVSVGYKWNITVWVKDVTDLFAYQVRMYYDSTMINATGAWVPTWDPIWVFYGKTTVGLLPIFGSDYVQIGDSLLGVNKFSGAGKLGIIEFQIIRVPEKAQELFCVLAIDNAHTFLLNYDLNEIAAQKTNGSYKYVWSPPATEPYLAVSPAAVRQPFLGAKFNIEISLIQLDARWQLTNATLSLLYNTTVIDVIGGSLNVTIDTNWAGPNEALVIHGEPDRINLTVRNPVVASGNLTIVTVAFTVMSHGRTNLTISDYRLFDHVIEIPTLSARNGSVNTEQQISDIAVLDVKPLKTIVGQGASAHVNVTLANEGDYSDTFTVTTYANTTPFQVKTLSLSNGEFRTVSFIWNTTGFAKGHYTISAYVTPLPGEVDIEDNSFLDGGMIVAMIGDISGPAPSVPDGKVDIRDVAMVALAFGSYPGHPRWNPNADITGSIPGFPDNKVDTRDIALVAKNFGKIDP